MRLLTLPFNMFSLPLLVYKFNVSQKIEPLQKHKYFTNYYLQTHPWSLFLLPLPPTSRGTQ